MLGANAPKVVSARHASDDSSSFDLVGPGVRKRTQAGSKTHEADAIPDLGGGGHR